MTDNLRMLAALELPRDVELLLQQWKPPRAGVLEKAKRERLLRATRRLLAAWRVAVYEHDALPQTAQAGEKKLSGVELRAALLAHIVLAYGMCALELIVRSRRHRTQDLPGMARDLATVGGERKPASSLDSASVWLAETSDLVSLAFALIGMSAGFQFTRDVAPALPGALVEQRVAEVLRRLFTRLTQAYDGHGGDWEKAVLNVSLTVLLGWRVRLSQMVLDEAEGSLDPQEWMPIGPFDALRPDQLSGLASRTDAAIKRYGAKRVERVFEAQLNLIVQSLGFIVVAARTGQRRVDLVCISGGVVEPMTFLVEAKSSRRPYTLPTADERALREYVADVRRTLTTLPTLRFVLLVGGEAGKSLRGRIRRVSGELGVPVRFLAAKDLARLRLALVGPLRMEDFVAHLFAGPEILDETFIARVVAERDRIEAAHIQLVSALLPRHLPSDTP